MCARVYFFFFYNFFFFLSTHTHTRSGHELSRGTAGERVYPKGLWPYPAGGFWPKTMNSLYNIIARAHTHTRVIISYTKRNPISRADNDEMLNTVNDRPPPSV